MEKTNKILYENIINDFKQRLISEEKKLSILNFIKFNNFNSQKFFNDIALIIEDYNIIITQAIQSIKSLLSENEKIFEIYQRDKKNKNKQQESSNINKILKYNYFNNSNNTYDANNNIVDNNYYNDLNDSNSLFYKTANQTLDYSSVKNNNNSINQMNNLNNITIKTPIREQLRFKIRNKNPKKFSLKRNKINYYSENNEKVKLTNEIFKNINIINNNKNFFIDKYINSDYLNNNEKYKNLLYNLIEYKFDMNILIDILRDINAKEKEVVKYNTPYN